MSPTRGTRTRGGAGSVGEVWVISHPNSPTTEVRGRLARRSRPTRALGPHTGNPYYKKRHQTAIAAAATRPRQHRSGGDDTRGRASLPSRTAHPLAATSHPSARALSLISSCTGILPALARQGQAAVSSSSLSDASKAYRTLPVFGSMRLPPTRPVVGSVPLGRRKSRMCGSGLQWVARGSGALASWRASLERAVVESRWQVGAGGQMRSGMVVGAWERSVGAERGPRGCSPVDGIVHPAAALQSRAFPLCH